MEQYPQVQVIHINMYVYLYSTYTHMHRSTVRTCTHYTHSYSPTSNEMAKDLLLEFLCVRLTKGDENKRLKWEEKPQSQRKMEGKNNKTKQKKRKKGKQRENEKN